LEDPAVVGVGCGIAGTTKVLSSYRIVGTTTVGVCSRRSIGAVADITSVSTCVLRRNNTIVTTHTFVAITEVLIVVIGLAVVGTFVNQTSSATYADVA